MPAGSARRACSPSAPAPRETRSSARRTGCCRRRGVFRSPMSRGGLLHVGIDQRVELQGVHRRRTAARTCSRYAARPGTPACPAVGRALLGLLQPRCTVGWNLPRRDDLVERLHRHAVAVRARNTASMSGLKPLARGRALRPRGSRRAVDRRRIDDGRAGAPQVLDRRHEHLHDLRVGRVALVGLPQHADARAAQRRRDAAPRRSRGIARPRAAAVAASSGPRRR